MLMATFLAISVPLHANNVSERERRDGELKTTYISTARYVGEELADNIVRIEDIITSNKKTIKELGEKFPNATDEQKAQESVGIWKGVAEDLVLGLEDINHRSLIMSGILTRFPDSNINSEIKNAYSKMTNLRQTLRRLSLFFGMILSPPPNFPNIVIVDLLSTKVPESIKATEADINYFLESSKVAIKAINATIKPYKMQVEIITYSPGKGSKKHGN